MCTRDLSGADTATDACEVDACMAPSSAHNLSTHASGQDRLRPAAASCCWAQTCHLQACPAGMRRPQHPWAGGSQPLDCTAPSCPCHSSCQAAQAQPGAGGGRQGRAQLCHQARFQRGGGHPAELLLPRLGQAGHIDVKIRGPVLLPHCSRRCLEDSCSVGRGTRVARHVPKTVSKEWITSSACHRCCTARSVASSVGASDTCRYPDLATHLSCMLVAP
jgi:hypothetical protein